MSSIMTTTTMARSRNYVAAPPPSPASSHYSSRGNGGALMLKTTRSSPPSRKSSPPQSPSMSYDIQASAERFLALKDAPFVVSGALPIEQPLNLFFQGRTGGAHMLQLPIDPATSTTPAFDAFLTAFDPAIPPIGKGTVYDLPDRHSLIYPATSSYGLSLDLCSGHPILETVRDTLFPNLTAGQHLVAVRDKLEMYGYGNYARTEQDSYFRTDGLAATIMISLPIGYRGGALIVRNRDGVEETFTGHGSKAAELQWTAFLAGCEHEVQIVEAGFKVNLVYNVMIKGFGPVGPVANPLLTPNEGMLDSLVVLLNRSRNRRLGFFLKQEYGMSARDVVADSLVPLLKGSDLVLYHAMKLYGLETELRYTAGGYIWPVDMPAEVSTAPSFLRTARRMRLPSAGGPDDDLVMQVSDGGAIPMASEDIILLQSPLPSPMSGRPSLQSRVSKERVPFVSPQDGDLDFLHVNVIMVVNVP